MIDHVYIVELEEHREHPTLVGVYASKKAAREGLKEYANEHDFRITSWEEMKDGTVYAHVGFTYSFSIVYHKVLS